MTIEFDSFATEPERSARSPRRRAAATLGATMLVAAAGGIGFGIGQAGGDEVSLSPADTPNTAEADTAPPDTATLEPERQPETPPTTSLAEPTADIAASGGGGWTVFGGEPMSLLAERTTESGAVLRAHLGQLWDHGYSDDGYDGWQPPGWCFESGQVRIALGGAASTGPNVIDVGAVSWWSEPFKGRAVSALAMGLVDSNPYRVVFIQAPASVTNVTVVFGDGATDSVAPSNGVALLAVPGLEASTQIDAEWTPPPTDFEVTFEEAATEPVAVAGDRTGWGDPEFQASCSPPPPELPEPGEQPSDPTTAEETIIDLMTAIYSDDDGSNEDRFDDPTGIAEARDEIRTGSFEEAAANAEAIIEELVFTTPAEAWFRYRIETTTGIFSERYGIAVNIDGVWKITRETICQDLALAGGNCGGEYIENIRPPGS